MKEIKLKVPDKKDIDNVEAMASKWYQLCPWCGYKSPCYTTFSTVCYECGGNALVIPCGIVREV